MKKTILIFILLALIAAAGIGGYLYFNKPKDMLTDVLPQSPLAYVQFSDVEQGLKKLATMPVWISIRDLNYDLLQKESAGQGKQWQILKMVRDQILAITSSPVSKKLFGNEVAFAVYPPDKEIDVYLSDIKSMDPALAEELFAGFRLLTRVDRDVQLAEFTARFFNQFGDNVTRGEEVYKDETVHTITINNLGIQFGLVRLNDIMIIGIGGKAARSSIDVYKKDQSALSLDPQFVRLKKEYLEPSQLTALFNFKALGRFLEKQMESFMRVSAGGDEQDFRRQGEEFMAQLSGFETLGISSQLEPVVRVSYHMLFDPKKLNPDFAEIYTCPARENQSIRFIPKDVLGYQWNNCLNLGHYWQQLKMEMAQRPDSTEQIAMVEAQTGFNIEADILPAFGDEFGGYIQDIQIGGLFPVPKMVLFIKIQDRGKAQRLLARLKEQPFIRLQQENYNGIPLEFVALPLGQDISPGFCFIDDYLLVATSNTLLRSSIDASKEPSMSLLANPTFKEVDFGLTDKNRSVQFIMVGSLIDKIKGVARWGNQWVSDRDKKTEAFKAGSTLPLEEVRADLQRREKELDGLHDRILPLEDEIWLLETRGEDVSAKKAEKEDVQKQIAAVEVDIAGLRDREADLSKIIPEYKEQAPNPSLRKLYLEEVVNPILDSMKSIKASGLRATVEGDVFESSIILKMNR